MSEKINSSYEKTPQGLKQRLIDLGTDHLACTKTDFLPNGGTSLFLDAATGERIIITKAIKGSQPEGNFMQDLNMQVVAGTNPSFSAEQIDYNFNEKDDGILRKRVFGKGHAKVEMIPENASEEGMAYLGGLTLNGSLDTAQNLALEEKMGLNNQAASTEQVAEAMAYLDGASVLDGNNGYLPVAVIPSNQQRVYRTTIKSFIASLKWEAICSKQFGKLTLCPVKSFYGC